MDGDQFALLWDPRLVPPDVMPPLDYDALQTEAKQRSTPTEEEEGEEEEGEKEGREAGDVAEAFVRVRDMFSWIDTYAFTDRCSTSGHVVTVQGVAKGRCSNSCTKPICRSSLKWPPNRSLFITCFKR